MSVLMRRVVRGCLVVHFVAVAVVLAWGWWSQPVSYGNRPFDAKIWKAPDRHGTTVREEMAGSLTRTHQLKGMTLQEVTQLLGPPDSVSYAGGADYGRKPRFKGQKPSYIAYDLGPVGYGIELAHLQLRMRGGRVLRWDVYQDQ
jgi:hypothetical protein